MIENPSIRKLSTPKDLEAAYALQMQAYASLADQTWFEPLERSFFETFDPKHTTVFGYYQDTLLIGIGILYVPQYEAESLSSMLDMDEDAFLHVAHLEVIATHPIYRKHGIATQLSQAIKQEAKEKGKRYLMATVHPKNSSSFHVLTSLEMQISKKIKLYGEKERYMMVLKLET